MEGRRREEVDRVGEEGGGDFDAPISRLSQG